MKWTEFELIQSVSFSTLCSCKLHLSLYRKLWSTTCIHALNHRMIRITFGYEGNIRSQPVKTLYHIQQCLLNTDTFEFEWVISKYFSHFFFCKNKKLCKVLAYISNGLSFSSYLFCVDHEFFVQIETLKHFTIMNCTSFPTFLRLSFFLFGMTLILGVFSNMVVYRNLE